VRRSRLPHGSVYIGRNISVVPTIWGNPGKMINNIAAKHCLGKYVTLARKDSGLLDRSSARWQAALLPLRGTQSLSRRQLIDIFGEIYQTSCQIFVWLSVSTLLRRRRRAYASCTCSRVLSTCRQVREFAADYGAQVDMVDVEINSEQCDMWTMSGDERRWTV
jgi:hypothetical protein